MTVIVNDSRTAVLSVCTNGRFIRGQFVRHVSSTAMMPVRNTPSKVPAPPMDAIPDAHVADFTRLQDDGARQHAGNEEQQQVEWRHLGTQGVDISGYRGALCYPASVRA